MRREFSDFCMNKNNELVLFWDKVCKDYDQKQQQQQKEQQQQQQVQKEQDE